MAGQPLGSRSRSPLFRAWRDCPVSKSRTSPQNVVEFQSPKSNPMTAKKDSAKFFRLIGFISQKQYDNKTGIISAERRQAPPHKAM